MSQETVVIGLGNPLMTDEGIGVWLISELLRQKADFPRVGFYDLGTSGTRVLHTIAGKNKAVFVDCALMGEKPGTIRRFTPEEVMSVKALEHFSLHEGDLMAILRLSRRLGEYPGEVVIFGIQPVDLSPGKAISPTLAAGVGEYLAIISEELHAL